MKTDWMWGDKGLPDIQIRVLGEEWSHDKEYVGGEQTGHNNAKGRNDCKYYLWSTNTQNYTLVSFSSRIL